MFIEKKDRPVEIREKCANGKGSVEFVYLCDQTKLPPHIVFAADMILEKGCSIGRHPHIGETEFYYCVSGEGVTLENGEERILRPGDVTLTGAHGGKEHFIENRKDEPLVVMGFTVSVE